MKVNLKGNDDVTNMCYKYEVERLDVVMQKGKTTIRKARQVAKVHIELRLLMEWFGERLSTNVRLLDNDRMQLCGRFDYDKLYVELRGLIDAIIICPRSRDVHRVWQH